MSRAATSRIAAAVVAGALASACATGAETKPADTKAKATAPAWKLAVQAWTFHDMTLFEAIDNTKAAGVKYIELIPGQKLSKDDGDALDHNSPAPVLEKVKKKLAEAGVRAIAYGVVGLGTSEAENRKVFEFAKAMGLETIVSEPEKGSFELLDTLTGEYGIKVAIHNHPKPSTYWDPDTVLEAVKGTSSRIGSCADTGHWMRSGIDPMAALKKLEGRIVSCHFKDLGEFGNPGAHDEIWGTGKADARALLAELHRQGFDGVVSIEYEHNWGKSLPDVTACAKFFNEVTAELAAKK